MVQKEKREIKGFLSRGLQASQESKDQRVCLELRVYQVLASRVEQGHRVRRGCLDQRGMEDSVSQASRVRLALRGKTARWDHKETQDLQG